MPGHPLALEGGFRDAVFQSQTLFRAIMDAIAEPGTVRQIADCCEPPAAISATTGAIALTLCDHDTTVWLAPSMDTANVRAWLAFQTGTQISATPGDADFAFAGSWDELPALAEFASGSMDYPDRSTTIILEARSFDSGLRFDLKGPGIELHRAFACDALTADFPTAWSANRALFPRGFDLVLSGPGGIAALPRTTAVKSVES